MKSLTLPELLIVVSIISILGGILLLNFPFILGNVNLKIGTTQLAEDIEKQRNFSLVFAEGAKAYGLKIEKDKTSYFLFDDTNGNGKMEPSEKNVEKELPSKIQISFLEIKKDTTLLHPNYIYLTFFPPKPEVKLITSDSGSFLDDWKYIKIQIKIENKSCPTGCKEIKVNPFGIVER